MVKAVCLGHSSSEGLELGAMHAFQPCSLQKVDLQVALHLYALSPTSRSTEINEALLHFAHISVTRVRPPSIAPDYR